MVVYIRGVRHGVSEFLVPTGRLVLRYPLWFCHHCESKLTLALQVGGNLPPDPVFSPLHQTCLEFFGTLP